MQPYATKLAEAFSSKLMEQVYAKSIFNVITNSDYEGDVQEASIVNIPALARIQERVYTPVGFSSPDDINEIVAQLHVNQRRSFYFRVRDIDQYLSFIKDPASKTIVQRADQRRANVDSFVLSHWGDVGAGNWVGTDVTAGTVAIAATTGVVTGTGTAFTSAMVGRPFRAVGHGMLNNRPIWYRVRTFTSATSITIEDDRDDVATALKKLVAPLFFYNLCFN